MSDLLLHPLVWVAATSAAFATIAHLAWRDPYGPSDGAVGWLAALERHPGRVRLARAVGLAVPLTLAAWLRVAEPAELGLVAPTGPRGLAAAVALTVAAFFLIAAGATSFARATGTTPPERTTNVSLRWGSALLLEAVGLEAYWAFVRGSVLAVGLASGTAAVFISLGILALQGWADPTNRAAFVDPQGAGPLAIRAMKAVASAAVFMASGSLFACWALHCGLSLALCVTGVQPEDDSFAAPAGAPPALEPTIV